MNQTVTEGDASPLEQRAASIRALADGPLDVLIVGGGIVGCGALLDAASRGLRAGLIEQDDIAAGTSSRSSRLIHGGLRYLEQLRFGLVREALAERSRLLYLAPHLVHLEPLLFPLYGWPGIHRAFYGSGILLYDLLGSRREGGFASHLSREQTLDWTPALRRDGLQGSIVYHDGVEDDARLTLAVLRTALGLGATAATRLRATGLIEEGRRVAGVRARDLATGEDVAIRASRVLDATGVWGAVPDGPLSGSAAGARTARILPSRGAHLVVRRERIRSRSGITIRVPGKVVFLVPWPGHWLIGTTDNPYHGDPNRPSASPEEVDKLLSTVNHTLDVDLRREDVVGTFAGLRPLIASAKPGSTVKASREHRVTTEPNGLVRIGGGKYTTYRVMAKDAIDAVLGREAARGRPTRTADLRLVGAADRPALDALAAAIGSRHGLDARVSRRLVDRHGTEAAEVASLGEALGLLDRLGPDLDHLEVEVVWAARRELALSVDDVLARRTRLAQERPDRGESVVERVAALLGAELGWDDVRREREVETYLAGAHAEFDVPPPAVHPSAVPEPVAVEPA